MKQSEYLALKQGDLITWNGAKDKLLVMEKIVPEEMYIYTQFGGMYFWIDCAIAQSSCSTQDDSCVDYPVVEVYLQPIYPVKSIEVKIEITGESK